MPTVNRVLSGTGIGLRHAHLDELHEDLHNVPWLEVLTENLMSTHGPFRDKVMAISERVPVALHGVSLSVGGTDALDLEYIAELRRLSLLTNASIVSDHLCWTGTGQHNLHDLLPLPYTETALQHCVSRINVVQDLLARPLFIENPSSYLEFASNVISEAQFLAELSRESGCGLILDVNNIYVSCANHGYSVQDYFRYIDPDKIGYYHLAGHTAHDHYLLDSHRGPVPQSVIDLYRDCLQVFGRKPALLEWDEDIPDLATLLAERDRLEAYRAEVRLPRQRHPNAPLGDQL